MDAPTMSSPHPLVAELERHRIVPVVAEADPDKAMHIADALVAAGLPIAEITLRAAGAIDALAAVASRGDITTIAGTVKTPDEVDQVAAAGAKLIVSPGISAPLVERSAAIGLPVCPGVATPSDILSALSLGIDHLKFFPAEAAGGLPMLKALSGPFPSVRFMPTGGVSSTNVREYLDHPSVFACGGSWMVSPKLYADGRFEPVEQATREALRAVAEAV